jgi:hypothetical protein
MVSLLACHQVWSVVSSNQPVQVRGTQAAKCVVLSLYSQHIYCSNYRVQILQIQQEQDDLVWHRWVTGMPRCNVPSEVVHRL